MANSIESAKNYIGVLDEVYQRASVSGCLTSSRRMVRQGAHAKEIMVPRIEVSGLGDYVRNQGYAQGAIEFSYETHSPDYDRGLKLVADVMDVEEAGVMDCFVAAGSELQRTQVAPEADAYTFAKIAGFEGVTTKREDLSDASAEDLLASLRGVTSAMDEKQVSTGTRYLFITPTLNGVIQDFSYANPNRSNRAKLLTSSGLGRAAHVPACGLHQGGRASGASAIMSASEMKTRPRQVVGVRRSRRQ